MFSQKIIRTLLCAVPLLWSAGIINICAEVNTTIQRDRVAVWFDYSVRYYDHEADNAYTREDLAVMVDVVGTRFSTIVIDTAPVLDKLPPQQDSHSRLWVPTVVANYNDKHTANSSITPMKVIVTFDVAKIARSDHLTSFDIALYMAQTANAIYPKTVQTLMMYTGYSVFSAYYNVKDTVQQIKVAQEKLNSSYELGVFLDVKDCGKFRGSLGEKAKELLPHVGMIVTLLRPSYHQLSLDAEAVQKMFMTKFEDCERKLKEEKPEITVIPAVLWMSKKGSTTSMLQCWELMSNWAVKHDRYVIMYEAFDTPHGHLISDQGWWRLKNKADHVIEHSAFIEKIQDANLRQSTSGSILASTEDTSAEDETPSSSNQGRNKQKMMKDSSKKQTPPASSANEPSNLLYIVLVLLSVICTLLVAALVGVVYGFHNVVLKRQSSPRGSNYSSLGNGSSHNNFEDCDGINGSILEIRDTAPIVAVTYKK